MAKAEGGAERHEETARIHDLSREMHEVKMGIDARVEGTTMIITVPMAPPVPSSRGKMLIVASTHGFKPTQAIVDGKPVMLNLTLAI